MEFNCSIRYISTFIFILSTYTSFTKGVTRLKESGLSVASLKIMKDMYYNAPVLKDVTVRGLSHCSRECRNLADCIAINYNKDEQRCLMYSTGADSGLYDISPRDRWNYGQIVQKRECVQDAMDGAEGTRNSCVCSDEINSGPNICRLVQAIGIQDGSIPDDAFTASSAKNEKFRRTFDARLNGPGAWGCETCTQEKWVSKYIVRYTRDGNYWCFHGKYATGGKRYQETVFDANIDTTSIVRNDFRPPLVARMIRIYPVAPYDTSGKYRSALRIELYGCKQPSDKKVQPRSVSPFS